MLDIAYIRENADEVQKNVTARKSKADIAHLLELDEKRRAHTTELDTLRAELNKGSKTKPGPEQIEAMKKLSADIKAKEQEAKKIEQKFNDLLKSLPNFTHPNVPQGNDETENVVRKKVGEPKEYDFEPLPHWELGKKLNIIDNEKAANISGARFTYLKGKLAQLQFALAQFTINTLTSEEKIKEIVEKYDIKTATKPFSLVIPPVFIRPDMFDRMGRLNPSEDKFYIESDDLYLIGSAEHTLGPLHADETIPTKDLPIRYLGYSTAFRREAGSYGKDTRGILRMHQFDKLEMESFTTPGNGEEEQNLFVAIQEYIVEHLGLPYQVVDICTGDMGDPDYRQIDIEIWMPGQNTYRETHTSDYMTDYQARRLNTKTIDDNGAKSFVHMNDATALAMGRTLIAIMENYQTKDGTIEVPKILQEYCGFAFID